MILVDSASHPPVTDELVSDVRVLRCDRPGASLARNLGWHAANTEIVAFVDDDVRVSAGWADAIVRPFADSDCAFVTGRVAADVEVDRPVAVADFDDGFVIDRDRLGTVGATANCAFRRSVLEEAGGFDERLGPGTWFAAAEDLELFDRVIAAGHTGRYTPDARAVHLQWRQSRRSLLTLEWRYGKGMGARLELERRRDRDRARRLAREALLRRGLREISSDLTKRYEFGALAAATRTAGTLTGAAAARLRLR